MKLIRIQVIQCDETAQGNAYDSVNIHIQKAIELYAKRPISDYENSIKESTSAVETICYLITGMSGAQATLGKAIGKLTDKGTYPSCHGKRIQSVIWLYV